jgi:hypothetical protein
MLRTAPLWGRVGKAPATMTAGGVTCAVGVDHAVTRTHIHL